MKYFKTALPVIAYSFILFLSACKTGKEYQRPQIALPEKFNNAVSFADTSSIADIPWNSFFSDPDLLALITKGIAYNQDLLMAINRMDIAQQQAKQARLLQLPQLNLQATGQYTRLSGNSLNGLSTNTFLGSNHIENYQAILSLSWEADIWGKIRRQKEATLAEYLRSTEAVKTVQTQLVADIAQQYYNLLMLDRQLDITQKNLGLADSFLKATHLLKDAGMVNELAIQQAESQKEATAVLIPEIEKNILLQEQAIQILTGQLPGNVSRSGNLSQVALKEDLSAGLPSAMVGRRPDVRDAEMALVAANARVGVAQANMYPALNITAGGGLESFKASNWFNIPGSLFGLAAGTIAQPVFQRRQLKTQFEIAKIQREQSVNQFRKAVLVAIGEVSNALVKIDKLKTEQTTASKRVAVLEKAVRNANMLFKNGMADYLEVITAQGNLLQSELDQAAIKKEQLSAVIELYRSLGGGWK